MIVSSVSEASFQTLPRLVQRRRRSSFNTLRFVLCSYGHLEHPGYAESSRVDGRVSAGGLEYIGMQVSQYNCLVPHIAIVYERVTGLDMTCNAAFHIPQSPRSNC